LSVAEDQFSDSVMQVKKALLHLGVGVPNAQIVAERLAWMGESVWLHVYSVERKRGRATVVAVVVEKPSRLRLPQP
jgi:hypothetical protein